MQCSVYTPILKVEARVAREASGPSPYCLRALPFTLGWRCNNLQGGQKIDCCRALVVSLPAGLHGWSAPPGRPSSGGAGVSWRDVSRVSILLLIRSSCSGASSGRVNKRHCSSPSWSRPRPLREVRGGGAVSAAGRTGMRMLIFTTLRYRDESLSLHIPTLQKMRNCNNEIV